MNIFSFFSGAGFLDLGFELQGNFNVVFVNEFHKAFNDVYQYARQQMGIAQPIYGHHVEDITEYTDGKHDEKLTNLIELVNTSKQTDLTGFIGGPPCPDFSVAGRNKGRDGENGKLSGTYTELICRALPDFFVFENVKGLYRTARHREFFEELKMQFREHGYSMTEQLVNALEYGAPQDRDRIILIGFHHTAIERLHLPEADGKLLDFPWEAHKRYNLQTVKSLPWPTKTPYIIRKTKRFAIPERAVYFLKTKRTAGGTPPPQNIFDRLTPVFIYPKNGVRTLSEPRSFRFVASLPLFRASHYATSSNALYAATLCAFTILPRKARREPTSACAYEASSLAFAYETPPCALAL